MLTRVSDDVWWADLRGVNAYLVDDGALTLVDAGMPRQGRRIVGELSAAGFGPGEVDRILVTHYDFDHVGGLAAFDGLDATIYVGVADAPLVTGERRPDWRNRKGLFQRVTAPLVTPPRNPVVPVGEGDTVGSFTVHETPGHTDGHVAYVSERLSVGLLGDLVSESDGRLVTPPRFLCRDLDRVRRSVVKLTERAPDFEVAGVGHGIPFNRGGKDRLEDLARSL